MNLKLSRLQHLHPNGRAMVQWICGVKLDAEVPMDTLYVKLGIQEAMASLHKRLWECYTCNFMYQLGHEYGCSKLQRTREAKKNGLTCSHLGGINLQNKEAWRFGVGNSSHLLPNPMSGTPTAVK